MAADAGRQDSGGVFVELEEFLVSGGEDALDGLEFAQLNPAAVEFGPVGGDGAVDEFVVTDLSVGTGREECLNWRREGEASGYVCGPDMIDGTFEAVVRKNGPDGIIDFRQGLSGALDMKSDVGAAGNEDVVDGSSGEFVQIGSTVKTLTFAALEEKIGVEDGADRIEEYRAERNGDKECGEGDFGGVNEFARDDRGEKWYEKNDEG